MRKEVIGAATLYLGDCMEIMQALDDVGLVVTDPPYGIADAPNKHVDKAEGRRGPRGGKVNTWHAPSDWDKELDPSWLPVALRFGTVALFGQWRKRLAFEQAAGMEPRAEVVWAKDMHVGAPCPAAPRDERIWIFSESGIKPLRFETSVWDEQVIPTWSHKEHKNEKPVKLMKRLVSWLPGDPVLDPFMGSGTTGVACLEVGRRFVGIEINEQHFSVACRRVENAQRQEKLFA